MDARKGNIYGILNGNRQFLIPNYQRFYSWDTEQCTRLCLIVQLQRTLLSPYVVVNRRSHRYDSFLRLASETIILRQCTRNLIFVVPG